MKWVSISIAIGILFASGCIVALLVFYSKTLSRSTKICPMVSLCLSITRTLYFLLNYFRFIPFNGFFKDNHTLFLTNEIWFVVPVRILIDAVIYSYSSAFPDRKLPMKIPGLLDVGAYFSRSSLSMKLFHILSIYYSIYALKNLNSSDTNVITLWFLHLSYLNDLILHLFSVSISLFINLFQYPIVSSVLRA